MIGLRANAKHSALAHGVATARDVANSRGREHQIFVAHQLGYCGGDFRYDRTLKLLYLNFGGSVIKKELAKFSDGHTCKGTESLLVVGFKDQSRYIVLGRI